MSRMVGKAVGNLVMGAVNAIGKQLEETAKEQGEVLRDAALRIRSNERLRSRCGLLLRCRRGCAVLLGDEQDTTGCTTWPPLYRAAWIAG